jgi:hypothetical protein
VKTILTTLLLAATLSAMNATAAVDVAGVKFDDTAKVGAGETALNGAGLRGVLFIKAYAMALYLPQKVTTPAEAYSAKGAKRIRLVLLRDATGEQFADSLPAGIHKNHTEQEIVPLNARIEAFKATMLSIGNVAKGATIHLDWLPEVAGGVTRLTINGEKRSEDIPGEDFYRALLKIWMGDKPVQDDLKEKLLGKAA